MPHYQPNANLLAERVILVTGASEGIGRAVATCFAQYGATVVLLARHIGKLEAVYDEIVNQGWPQPAIYPCNLATANPQDYVELTLRIKKEFGRLDGLLHNAATLGSLTPIEHYDIRQWYTVLQTTLNAPFMLTRATLPLLKEAKDASIIFTEDSVGHHGQAYWGAYSVAKFGITGLRQVIADELENYVNIRVNSINPGKLYTRLRASAYPAENPSTLASIDSVLPAYLYLMGIDSRQVKGQCLNVQSETRQKGQLFDLLSTTTDV